LESPEQAATAAKYAKEMRRRGTQDQTYEPFRFAHRSNS
jgi:hypothetical protein